MNFSIEGILDEAKHKAVQEATAKFGPSATPTAEEIANKAEEMVAARMGVPLNNKNTAPAGEESNPADPNTGTNSNSGVGR